MSTQTERASRRHTQVVERSDYLIDFHGGDIDENLRPRLAEDRPHRRIARHGARVRPRPHHHHDRPAHRPEGLALSREHRGKPSITVEAGRAVSDPGRGGSRERHPERDAAPEDAAAFGDAGAASGSGSTDWPTWPASTRASSIPASSAAATWRPAGPSVASPTTSDVHWPRCAPPPPEWCSTCAPCRR